jgi:hypothetical protein
MQIVLAAMEEAQFAGGVRAVMRKELGTACPEG